MTDATIEELEQRYERYKKANEDSDAWQEPLETARENLLEAKQHRVEELEEYVSAAILSPEKREPAKDELRETRTEVEELEAEA